MVKLVHLHGFKCAGTTFSWILQKLFGEKLLYIETKGGNERLFWEELQKNINLSEYDAITSHTLEFPRISGNEYLFIEFVRHPLDRLKSAYKFQIKVADIDHDQTFAEFVKRSANTSRDNYMSRRLSEQHPNQTIWSLSNDTIDINENNLFVGLVEKFDESLVLLEDLVERKYGMKIDLSYASIQNKSKQDKTGNIDQFSVDDDDLRKICTKDLCLYLNVNDSICTAIKHTVNFDLKYQEFKERCKKLSAQEDLQITVKAPSQWKII